MHQPSGVISQEAAWPVARKITLLFIATMTIMAGATISPALPAIEQVFRSTEHVELMSRMVLTLPSIFVAACAPVAGALADRFGRKKLLIASILLYGVSGVSGLFVDSLLALLAGRAALGLAIGGIMTIGTALVGDYFTGAERERYLGLQQAFTQLGGVAFVVGGGLLADYHWRAPFAVYGVAFLILPAAMFFLSEPAKASGPQDALAVPDLSTWSWLSVIFLCAAAFLINASFYTVPSQLPFHLKELGLGQASNAGYVLGLFNLAAATTALNYGRLRRRVSIPAIFVVGFALMAVGFWLLAAAATFGPILLAAAVMGLGLGVVVPSLMSGAIAIAPPQARGRVAGVVTASMFLGHFVSPFASQPWIATFGYAGTYAHVGVLIAAMSAVAVLTVLAGRSRASVEADAKQL